MRAADRQIHEPFARLPNKYYERNTREPTRNCIDPARGRLPTTRSRNALEGWRGGARSNFRLGLQLRTLVITPKASSYYYCWREIELPMKF